MGDTLLSGNRFNLYRMVTGTPQFVCMGQTVNLTETKEFDDATMPPCDDPTAIPSRRSIVKSKAWSLNFSGKAIMSHYADIKADFDSEAAVPYRIVANPVDGVGNGQWDGDIHIESLEIAKQDNSMVTFAAQARGDGDLSFLDT